MTTHPMKAILALPALEPTKIHPRDYPTPTAKLISGGPDAGNWSLSWLP